MCSSFHPLNQFQDLKTAITLKSFKMFFKKFWRAFDLAMHLSLSAALVTRVYYYKLGIEVKEAKAGDELSISSTASQALTIECYFCSIPSLLALLLMYLV